jgi:DNA repair exonuclease SbcCD ATPase subunit
MLSEREEKANERRLLEEENRRLRFTTEALETENLLLQVQVSDLTQTVEELEDDVFYMKCGGKPGKGKRPQTPGSSSGHRVTFDDNTEDKDKKENEKLESLIQNAKERCKNLEKQVRSNTSLLKTTQHRNQTLLKDHEDLRRENCNLRQYLEECQRTKKILHIKITELEESLQSVDDGKSLDEMEKQSLIDRLKIFEGQIKSLKLERETMRSRVESLKAGSDNTQSSPYSKFLFLEEANHDALLKKNGLVDEVERLKNKIKKQSARSRILKSEVFEFLDDIRCLETELGSVVDGFDSTEHALEKSDGGDCKEGTTPSESEVNKDVALLQNQKIGESECETITEVNTWGVEASLCQQHGMTPVMIEIVELLKSTTNRLQRISRNSSLASVSSVDSIDGERHNSSHGLSDLRKQLSTEISELRNEKQILQREVFVLKAISENTLEAQPHSPEDVFETYEKDRTRYLRKQVLDSVQRNSELEGEILDYLTQKWALESELDNLKERILNLKNERDTLLSLGEVARLPCAGHNWGKSHEKSMRHFCFVKNRENEFEVHDVLRIEPDIDNEDVFSW